MKLAIDPSRGRHAGATKPGVTAIEVLISIAVITLMITLLLPAVQNAREAGRLSQCRSNLRQIGLAFQNHESSHGRFPSNGWDYQWLGEPGQGTGRHQPGGWIYNILAHIDRSDLRRLGSSSDLQIRLTEQQQLMLTPLPLMMCQSRPSTNPGPVASELYLRLINSHYPDLVSKNDYAVNAGSRRLGNCYGDAPNDAGVSADEFPWGLSLAICTGVVFQRSEIRYSDIVDGTTATILVGEKSVPAKAYHTASYLGFDASMYVGQCLDLQRYVDASPVHDLSNLHEGWGIVSDSRFGSAHNSGCPIVFCDGHVQIVSFYIDRQLFERLGDRNDGNVIGEF